MCIRDRAPYYCPGTFNCRQTGKIVVAIQHRIFIMPAHFFAGLDHLCQTTVYNLSLVFPRPVFRWLRNLNNAEAIHHEELMQTHWEQIADDLFEAGLFTKPSAKIHARAMFMCEYCGKFMLDSLDSWQGFECDHILPKSIYDKLRYDLNNHALSCKACNHLKRDWDVVETEREKYLSLDALTKEQRINFIDQCRIEIEKRRATSLKAISEVKKILLKNNLSARTK